MRALTADDMKSPLMGDVNAGFAANATPALRSTAVAALARLHEMKLDVTNSLTYDANLTEFGRNVKKDVRIGPSAFGQDRNWLGGVIYHELVHSDQFDVYTRHGVELTASEARNETERRLVALDEAEAFYRTWQARGLFKLSQAQIDVVWRRVIHKLIDVDDEPVQALAKKTQFADARLLLIKALPKQ
jgi:hypothetical protein